MTYEEFQKSLCEPINGSFDNVTIIIRMQRIMYDMHQEIEKLKNENYKLDQDIESLRQYINDVRDGIV